MSNLFKEIRLPESSYLSDARIPNPVATSPKTVAYCPASPHAACAWSNAQI